MSDTAPLDGGKKRALGAWPSHVKATAKANKGMSFKNILKLAGKTYKKTAKRGGGVATTASPLSGGRRRRTARKTRGRK